MLYLSEDNATTAASMCDNLLSSFFSSVSLVHTTVLSVVIAMEFVEATYSIVNFPIISGKACFLFGRELHWWIMNINRNNLVADFQRLLSVSH